MTGPMMPMQDPRRRRPELGPTAIGAVAAADPMMMGPAAAQPPMGPPGMMGGMDGAGMGPVTPEQADEFRRWFADARGGAARPMR